MAQRNVIFALVGPSGCGKSMLITEMLASFPERLGVVRSVTTRAKRSAEDEIYYRFVSVVEFAAAKDRGELIQSVEYAGNFYGSDRNDIDAVLRGRHGICALVEDGVRNFRDAGYRVIAVRILPSGAGYRNRDAGRELADARRASTGLPPDAVIENSFDPGGGQIAALRLADLIRGFIS